MVCVQLIPISLCVGEHSTPFSFFSKKLTVCSLLSQIASFLLHFRMNRLKLNILVFVLNLIVFRFHSVSGPCPLSVHTFLGSAKNSACCAGTGQGLGGFKVPFFPSSESVYFFTRTFDKNLGKIGKNLAACGNPWRGPRKKWGINR